MAAPGQDAAQPGTAPDGQGQGQDRTAYESILGQDAFADAPEELREHLTNYVRNKVDPALTQRFQDAAQFRQTWEPFSQIEGLTDLDPQNVDELVEFGYTMLAANDPQHPNHDQAVQNVQEMWEGIGEQFGFFEDDDGDGDGSDDNGNGGDPRIAQLEAQLAELRQGQQQSQMDQTAAQIQQEIAGYVENLALPQDPEKRQKAEDAVWAFMARYQDDSNISNEDMVKAAFADYQALVGDSQSDLLENHESAGTSVHGGRASNEPEEVKSWQDADRLAKARLGAGT